MAQHFSSEFMSRISSLLLIIGEVMARNEVGNFMVDNGHHYIDIFYNHSSIDWRQLIQDDLYISGMQIQKVALKPNNAFGVFLFDPEKDDMDIYLNHITQRKIKLSLLIIERPSQDDQLEIMQAWLSKMEATSFFYVALFPSNGSEATAWYQVLSLKTGSVVSGLTFSDNSSRIIERFDSPD